MAVKEVTWYMGGTKPAGIIHFIVELGMNTQGDHNVG
jgi:hypothetical protein